jgi:hypothetical protein
MKKFLSTLSVLAFALSFSYAQYVKKPMPDSLIKVIPFGEGRHAGYLYTVGGKLQAPEDIQMRLLNYAPSAVEFKIAKREVPWSFAFLGASALTSTGAIIEFYKNSKPPIATAAFINGRPGFTYTYPNNNKTGAYILTGAAIGFITATISTWINEAIHIRKSVYLYNQQYE